MSGRCDGLTLNVMQVAVYDVKEIAVHYVGNNNSTKTPFQYMIQSDKFFKSKYCIALNFVFLSISIADKRLERERERETRD